MSSFTTAMLLWSKISVLRLVNLERSETSLHRVKPRLGVMQDGGFVAW